VVVLAVTCLLCAGVAHALSVDIVIPQTDPYEVRQYQRRYFEAVCHDARGNDVTEMAAFSWDFGDGTEPDPNNPALHQCGSAPANTGSL